MRIQAMIEIRHLPRHQRGAVLIFGMLLLLVMTIIGVTAMRSATLEERMAANESFVYQSMQAAESAIDLVARDMGALSSAIIAGKGSQIDVNDIDLGYANDLVSVTADVVYQGEAIPAGYSLGSGGFVDHRMDITGQGSVQNAGARTTIQRGVLALAPSAQ
jgi:hypothetical protein